MLRKAFVVWPLLLIVALLAAACVPIQSTNGVPVTLDNGVVGTLNQPLAASAAQPAPPVVLMLHGFGSTKDEVGNMYAMRPLCAGRTGYWLAAH